MKLFAKRIPLGLQRQQLTNLSEQITSFGKERDRIVELMKQYNLEGASDKRQWDVIQRNFQFEERRISEAEKQRMALIATLYPRQLEFVKECVEEITRLNQLLVPTIVAVREELGLPIDQATYARIIQEAIEKQRANLTEFLEKARCFVAQPSSVVGSAEAVPPS